ncbi:TIR domain-containing protein [Microbacterium sp. NPDC087868]|uniref:toll/interleukin-1 receptor domain-containing protein n=1 Tax=Microbacterium sp. NPDC087868 TaxID=3364195 RepID=UPI00384BD6F2
MKVFISWSGDNSRHVAESLRTWLPTVLAGAVECFVSSQDIRRGERGMDVIAGELQDRDYGIVVLTRENMQSPWINFEAGALGKTLGVGKVAPLLLDLTRADVVGPIAQFQSTLLTDRDDVRQFIRDMAALSPTIPEASIDALFASQWPELEKVIERAVGMNSPTTTRTSESILEEVLERVRRIERLNAGASDVDKSTHRKLSDDVLDALSAGKDRSPITVISQTSKDGTAVTVDANPDTFLDDDAMQRVSNEHDAWIAVQPHDIRFRPFGTSRDWPKMKPLRQSRVVQTLVHDA